MDVVPPDAKRSRPLRSALFGVTFGLAMFLCETLPLLPGPRVLQGAAEFLINVSVLFVFPFLLAAIAVPLLLVCAWFSKNRKYWDYVVLSATVALSILAAIRFGGDVRSVRFRAVAERGTPVIRVLDAYRAKNGTYPETVALPATGIMAYPSFTYRRADGADSKQFEGYELAVDCSSGILNWDRFVYWPARTYPDYMYGGRVERIGDWAYVHE
jgi:hypothetical protein